jgi:hypothetical protein
VTGRNKKLSMERIGFKRVLTFEMWAEKLKNL